MLSLRSPSAMPVQSADGAASAEQVRHYPRFRVAQVASIPTRRTCRFLTTVRYIVCESCFPLPGTRETGPGLTHTLTDGSHCYSTLSTITLCLFHFVPQNSSNNEYTVE